MSDIRQVKEDIMAIAEGIIADAEKGSKDPDIVLGSLENAARQLTHLRSILPDAKKTQKSIFEQVSILTEVKIALPLFFIWKRLLKLCHSKLVSESIACYI